MPTAIHPSRNYNPTHYQIGDWVSVDVTEDAVIAFIPRQGGEKKDRLLFDLVEGVWSYNYNGESENYGNVEEDTYVIDRNGSMVIMPTEQLRLGITLEVARIGGAVELRYNNRSLHVVVADREVFSVYFTNSRRR